MSPGLSLRSLTCELNHEFKGYVLMIQSKHTNLTTVAVTKNCTVKLDGSSCRTSCNVGNQNDHPVIFLGNMWQTRASRHEKLEVQSSTLWPIELWMHTHSNWSLLGYNHVQRICISGSAGLILVSIMTKSRSISTKIAAQDQDIH